MGGAERPRALARHLGELGEIRITRVEPEKRVEWEAEDASGSVLLKPSGWGTKVTPQRSPASRRARALAPEPEHAAAGRRPPADRRRRPTRPCRAPQPDRADRAPPRSPPCREAAAAGAPPCPMPPCPSPTRSPQPNRIRGVADAEPLETAGAAA